MYLPPSRCGMVEANTQNSDERLYLDDLFVGQRFTSRTHVIDEAQIKAFAQQFDPQPFHQDEDSAKATLFAGLAAVDARRSPSGAAQGRVRSEPITERKSPCHYR